MEEKIKMSEFEPATEAKDTDEIIILQDGINKRLKSPIFEQKVIDKVGDGFLRKDSKIPNGNLTFGEVAEGDLNVVSGGDVFDEFNKIKKTIVEPRNPYLTDEFDFFINIKNGTRFTKKDGIIKQHVGTDNVIFKYPDIFRFMENTIYQNNNGAFIRLDFYEEVSTYYRDTTKYYVDGVNGLDSNSGLSADKAMKSIRNCYRLKNARNIVLIGYFERNMTNIDFELSDSKPLIITSYKGIESNLTSNDDATLSTWTSDSGLYKSTISAVFNIYDFNTYLGEKRGYKSFKLVSTKQECIDTPFSFFKDLKNVIFINNNGNSIGSNIKISRQQSSANMVVKSDIPFIYAENINIYAQDPESAFGVRASTKYITKAITNNVKSYGNKIGDAIGFNNIPYVYNMYSGGFECRRDANNYHTSISTLPKMKAIEIDCWSLDTGKDFPTEGSSNGSTAHDGMSIIRLGGNFDTSNGSTIVDVNSGIESINFNVTAINPTRNNTASFHVQEGNMWLYSCKAWSGKQSIRQDGANGNVYINDVNKIGATFGNVNEITTY